MSVMQELINDSLGCYFATVMELLQYVYSQTPWRTGTHGVLGGICHTFGRNFLGLNYICIIKHTCIQSWMVLGMMRYVLKV